VSCFEGQTLFAYLYDHGITFAHVARQNLLGQRGLQLLLGDPFERTGAKDRVIAALAESVYLRRGRVAHHAVT